LPWSSSTRELAAIVLESAGGTPAAKAQGGALIEAQAGFFFPVKLANGLAVRLNLKI